MPTFKDIALLRVNYLRGPSIWTYREVLEVWLDLGELEEYPSNKIPGFPERLKTWLPGLVEHHCGVGERGGFLMRLDEGTWPGHILEHIIIELLNLAGMPTAFGQTRSTSQYGVYRMVFRAKDEQVARVALREGHRLIMAAINDQSFDVALAVSAIREVIEERYLGPSTAAIVDAAFERRIPAFRLNDGNLVQLGYGSAQKRIWTTETANTSAIAEGIANDKDMTKTLIQICGVPVPEWQVAESPAEAWEAAQDIGVPVVVKPSDASRNRGVFVNLRTQAEVEAAWTAAEPHGYEVMVERMVPGNEHRLLVVGGKVVAAARSESLKVTGDGQSSVAQLIDKQVNSDPRRKPQIAAKDSSAVKPVPDDLSTTFRLQPVDVRQADILHELKAQELTPESVPASGKLVLIQRSSTLVVDCTDDVHPETAEAAALAAKVVGLDIAGVDVMAQDIAMPLAAQGGAIIEVNAGPGLLMHLKPAVGSPQPVGQAIVEHLFPVPAVQDGVDAAGRIPIIGISGRHGTTGIARLVAWLLHLSGKHTGVACRQGIFLDKRCVDRRQSDHWEAGNRLLMNQQIEVAVIENSPRSILAEGLSYDRCHIGVVSDMAGHEELVDFDIQEKDQMTRVLRTQVDVVLSSGVAILNADDAQVADLARLSDGGVVFYATDAEAFARWKAQQAQQARDKTEQGKDDGEDAAALDSAAGSRWVLVRGDAIELWSESGSECIEGWQALSQHACTLGLQPTQLLASTAIAWAMGTAPELIGAGIRTFDPRLPGVQPVNRVVE
ncbi:cyanophycin synthetase [Lampropedia puyangensis]|uniref:Cyanophycin synthetase n=1 Tax=Lampropedia puyangensis TaxID=1330072 RepID=A0A4S8F8G5_9BURK|nr:cyanophycin synthetase [Lampropedia puyangensis]THU02554.1 cyanophycin synthetase [Lampropedia puyangensis]